MVTVALLRSELLRAVAVLVNKLLNTFSTYFPPIISPITTGKYGSKLRYNSTLQCLKNSKILRTSIRVKLQQNDFEKVGPNFA